MISDKLGGEDDPFNPQQQNSLAGARDRGVGPGVWRVGLRPFAGHLRADGQREFRSLQRRLYR